MLIVLVSNFSFLIGVPRNDGAYRGSQGARLPRTLH